MKYIIYTERATVTPPRRGAGPFNTLDEAWDWIAKYTARGGGKRYELVEIDGDKQTIIEGGLRPPFFCESGDEA